MAKNTVCLWFDKDAETAARFYTSTVPDSAMGAVHRAPSDYPSGKQGDVLTVEFTVAGIPCLGLNGGPVFKHNEAFSFQVATDDQAETDRLWNAIVGNGGNESACGWCKDQWGLSWQITPRALIAAITDPDPAAAKRAFKTCSVTSRAERLDLLKRIVEQYKKRSKDLALAVSQEMGAPLPFALDSQVGVGALHLEKMIEVLKTYQFEQAKGKSLVVREPIGVVGLITPWNWPLNQITCKVGPALAAGCTMVLKPSEIAPLDAIIFAEILHEAGVPKGVFNLVNGDGPTVGQSLAQHPDVDMMSFTGSTRAGILVAKSGADTVKRIHQEPVSYTHLTLPTIYSV